MTYGNPSLNDLIEVLNDGIALFEQATEHSKNKTHIELFQRIRHLKETIVADLKAEVALNGGEPSSEGSWLGNFRKTYADLKAKMTSNPEYSYISALEEQEDRVLKTFHDAVANTQPSRIRDLATTYLPEVQRMHDTLRELKLQEKAKTY